MRKKWFAFLLLPLVAVLWADAPAAVASPETQLVKIMDATKEGDKTALRAALSLHSKYPTLDFEVRRKPDPKFSPDITLYDGAPKKGDRLYSVRRIYVTVNQSNPLKNLTMEQLKGVCSGKITEWTNLNGSPFSIHRYALALRAGPDVIRSIVGKGNPASFYRAGNDKELYLMMAGNQNAIGFSLTPPDDPKVKVVPIEGKLPQEKSYSLVLLRSLSLHRAGAAQQAFAAQISVFSQETKKVK